MITSLTLRFGPSGLDAEHRGPWRQMFECWETVRSSTEMLRVDLFPETPKPKGSWVGSVREHHSHSRTCPPTFIPKSSHMRMASWMSVTATSSTGKRAAIRPASRRLWCTAVRAPDVCPTSGGSSTRAITGWCCSTSATAGEAPPGSDLQCLGAQASLAPGRPGDRRRCATWNSRNQPRARPSDRPSLLD